jgi:dTDP-4-amino-4,6-dideoxygalactose transaminase
LTASQRQPQFEPLMNKHSRLDPAPVPFIDLAAQRRRLGPAVDAAVARVLQHCQFVMGPEVRALEAELARFAGARHVLTCASGTDALLLVLMAQGVGPGHAVFCPSFTFCATAEVAALLGATPVFVDIDPDTFNIDSASLQRAIGIARQNGLTPRAVIPVDLFGLPADHDAVVAVAAAENLFILDDAAQAFGASYKGRPLGTFGHATATSFFPAKPLGCYGDGGAVLTDDDELAERVKSLRIHGQGNDKYDNVRIGITGRLDTVQAAVLLEKLKLFPEEIEARNRIAGRYGERLAAVSRVPIVPPEYRSVWAQYTIRLRPGLRDGLAAALKAEGIPTAIYYPKPLHRQTAYRHYPVAAGGLPVSDAIAAEVLSLPMHPYLEIEVQDRIIDAVLRHSSRQG